MKINDTHYRTIWPEEGNNSIINIIDQRHLPHRFIVEQLKNVEDTFAAIAEMHVRGAGLIGATAGFGMHLAALCARDDHFDDDLQSAARYLCSSRPTAKNLAWAVDRCLLAAQAYEEPQAKRNIIFQTACLIADEDASFCKKLGEHGKSIIEAISRKRKGQLSTFSLTAMPAGWPLSTMAVPQHPFTLRATQVSPCMSGWMRPDPGTREPSSLPGSFNKKVSRTL